MKEKIKEILVDVYQIDGRCEDEAAERILRLFNVSSSSIQMNTFRQELIDLYMQGYYDRDWKISEDKADEKAEMYADTIMKKYKL